MKYAIIGAGAIGGYYGGLLARGGKEVHFLFHTDYEFVKQHGLQVDSHDGDFHLNHVLAYHSTMQMPQCDVVIVCLKTHRNEMLPELLGPLLKPDTLVLLIQNGIGVEADLQKMIPHAHLAAGLAFVCSGKVGPGHIHHQFFGQLTIAPYSFNDTERLQLIVEDMSTAGVDVIVNLNYLQARWRKAVWNIPFNGLTVVLNTCTERLLTNENTRNLVKELMMETIQAANAIDPNVGIDAEFAQKMIENTLVMPPYSPSMKLDFDNHREMEIKYLYHRSIEDAAEAGCDMPKVKMLAQQLEFIAANEVANR